jgi:hypothetical protein
MLPSKLEFPIQTSSDLVTNLYEVDFYAWTQEQSSLLSRGQWQSLDIENLVEEIESLGKQQKQELRNRLAILIGHLLKWDFQPEFWGKSWKATIIEQRERISLHLKDNPSLKPYLNQAVIDAYKLALSFVVPETPLDYSDLPSDCPYAIAQILDPHFPENFCWVNSKACISNFSLTWTKQAVSRNIMQATVIDPEIKQELEPQIHLWSIADYHRMIEAGILDEDDRVELLEGKIVCMSPQRPFHSASVQRSANHLYDLLRGKAYIRMQLPVILGDDSEPEPDVAVVRFDENEYSFRACLRSFYPL